MKKTEPSTLDSKTLLWTRIPLTTHRYEWPTPRTRHHVPRKGDNLQHVGDRGDCGSAGAEGAAAEAHITRGVGWA